MCVLFLKVDDSKSELLSTRKLACLEIQQIAYKQASSLSSLFQSSSSPSLSSSLLSSSSSPLLSLSFMIVFYFFFVFDSKTESSSLLLSSLSSDCDSSFESSPDCSFFVSGRILLSVVVFRGGSLLALNFFLP
jgi:hypothetical protein